MIQCPDCGGFLETGSCVCNLAYTIREKLKAKLKLTDKELNAAFDNGDLVLVDTGRCDSVKIEEGVIATLPYTFEAKK